MDTIIDKCQVEILAFCYRKLKGSSLAQDITQDTFVKYLSKGKYKNKPLEEARKLLLQIANHKIIDYYRQSNRQREIIKDYQSHFNFLDSNDFKNREFFAKTKINLVVQKIETGKIELSVLEKLIYVAIFKDNIPYNSNVELAEVSGLNVKKVASAKKTLFRKIVKYFK